MLRAGFAARNVRMAESPCLQIPGKRDCAEPALGRINFETRCRGGKLISVVLEHKFLVVRGWISFWLRDVAVASSLFQEGEPTKMWYLALSILLMPSIADK